MQGINPRKSLFFHVILWGLYVLFFAVQLHLKYSWTAFDYATNTTVSFNQAGKKMEQASASGERSDSSKPEIRLNKRYFPNHFAAVEPFDQENDRFFLILTIFSNSHAATLHNGPVDFISQRGPPVFLFRC